MTANPCLLLEQFGQSLWLDYIKRSLITSGDLKQMITQDGLKGMTSNPSIFEKAIVESHDYDVAIRTLVNEGKNVDEIYEHLSQQDIQMAADEFRPVYERTEGFDGMVSIEVNPHLAHDTEGTIAEARNLWKEINRPNIFVKVPATLQGLPAITQLISEGINVNVTLLFGLPRYRQVAAAFLAGLQRRIEQGLPLKKIASVASFFLSRIDVLLTPVLDAIIKQGGANERLAKKLQGQVAIASAKIAYQIYKDLFAPEKFKPFADKGARPQRLLWASTSTKNPAYSDVKFVEALIGPDTVNTVPLETFNKFKDHGKASLTLEKDVDNAFWVFEQLPKVGIDIDKATQQLEDEGVQKFIEPFDKLMESLKMRYNTMEHKSRQIAARYHSRHHKVKDYDLLRELALNLRWSWNRGTDALWQRLEPELWERTHNPWVVLETASSEKVENLLHDPHFRKELDNALQLLQEEEEPHTWFHTTHASSPLSCVAYFSMEFMLSEALPIYSGGLGNVAGDQLKAASDLGVPLVGIGLLYQQGYFRQMIDKDGNQLALYPYNDPLLLPISPLRTHDGEWLRIKISLPGCQIWLRAWEVNVGRVKLYLLDSNDAANIPAHRGITSELYGGGSELRLKQELILGIGGYRLLEALGIKPEVCHLNEGHAAFAVLERAARFMEEHRASFDVALTATRAGNLFTTHTAVSAAFDVFSPFLIEQHLGKYAQDRLGISVPELLALGRIHPNEYFNMAYLAIRGSGAINGVSRLHGKVSRQLFSPLFPKWPVSEVPIGSVTNGVHMPSWESSSADVLWTKACGKKRWLGDTACLEKDILKIPDTDIWQMRSLARAELVNYVRLKNSQDLAARGATLQEELFDPHTLTLGFARRFAEYKRPNMLLHDPKRLLRILTNHERPVQLIIAGKAHPEDEQGLALIKEWFLFMQLEAAKPHVIFLSDYDMLLTEQLVRGVDVWINTPRRPWEACGTSGMKVLVNGGLNLSELDGWWAESYSPEVGWAIGEDTGITSDTRDANMLYDLLENKIIPEFYAHDEKGLPTRWVKRIKESMARLTPRFSSNRVVREYTETYYLRAADQYLKRALDSAHLSKKLVEWLKLLDQHWDAIHFGEVKVVRAGHTLTFTVQVYLGKLDPESVKVELYADGVMGGKPKRIEMVHKSNSIYECVVTTTRPAEHYTPRLLPKHLDILFPLEAPLIKWQR